MIIISNSVDIIIKMRSDQYFNVKRLIKIFDNSQRLALCNYNAYSQRMYPFSDMMMAGNIKDMWRFWNIPFDMRAVEDICIESDLRYFMRQKTAEGYILSNYFQSIGYEPSWNQNESEEFMNAHFQVISWIALRFVWFRKYYWKNLGRLSFIVPNV